MISFGRCPHSVARVALVLYSRCTFRVGAVGAVRGRARAAGAGVGRGDPARQPVARAGVRRLRVPRAAGRARARAAPPRAGARALHIHAHTLRHARQERQEG